MNSTDIGSLYRQTIHPHIPPGKLTYVFGWLDTGEDETFVLDSHKDIPEVRNSCIAKRFPGMEIKP